MLVRDLWKDSRFISKVFSVLEDTPVRMISLGSSDINLSLVVPMDKIDDTVQKLHDTFSVLKNLINQKKTAAHSIAAVFLVTDFINSY